MHGPGGHRQGIGEGGIRMDKDRWAKAAIEMQEHLDALERICRRENIGMASISVSGAPEGCIEIGRAHV